MSNGTRPIACSKSWYTWFLNYFINVIAVFWQQECSRNSRKWDLLRFPFFGYNVITLFRVNFLHWILYKTKNSLLTFGIGRIRVISTEFYVLKLRTSLKNYSDFAFEYLITSLEQFVVCNKKVELMYCTTYV